MTQRHNAGRPARETVGINLSNPIGEVDDKPRAAPHRLAGLASEIQALLRTVPGLAGAPLLRIRVHEQRDIAGVGPFCSGVSGRRMRR